MSTVQIEKYVHHGVEVNVIAAQKGNHRNICLCFQNCKFFKPGQPDNCEIAQANYELCVKFNTVQPMLECPKYEPAA